MMQLERRAVVPSALATLALPLVLAGAGRAHAQEPIRWLSGPEALTRAEPVSVVARLREVSSVAGRRHAVVQFRRPVVEEARRSLAAAGVHLQSYLGSNAYFALIDARELDARAAAAAGAFHAVAEVERAWKLHPDVLAGNVPEHALVGEIRGEEAVAGYAIFHADVSLDEATRIARRRGARVRDRMESINGLVIEIGRSRIGDLADEDALQWFEAALPRMSEVWVNDSNRAITQADLVQTAPYNLDGSGVTVLVYDGGTARASHTDFSGRLTVRDASGLSNHPTHVSGTVGGDGTSSAGTFTGMAPGVTIESYGFQFDGTGIFLYSNPGDFESDYNQAINTFGADISNNSIGTNTETNGFICNIQGDYGVMSSMIDAVVRGSLGSPFRIVWANGNERQGSRCDLEGFGDYYSTAPPATAKNHIAVGALNSNNDSMTSFSSWGPTDDGRIKPDISSAGCQSNGDGGVTSPGSASDVAYSTLCGTSMASPTVCGLSALILEDYRVQFGGSDPRNSTLKALLAQNAADLGMVGPDYQFGYGSVRVKDTIDDMRLGNFTEDSIDFQGESFLYSVTVGGGDPELKLTLAWDDVPGTPNVFGALVNDLDLVVVDPLGTQHFPWTLNPASPGNPAVQVQADHVNNIEQVAVTSPMAGTWTVEIHGFDVPSGPQPYSLISSHALSSGPFIQIGFPSGVPSQLTPGSALTVTAEIVGVGDTVVGGSPTLYFRYDGGSYLSLQMASVGGDQYEADLPPPVCGATPEFYVEAEGAVSGLRTNPGDAPTGVFQASVEVITVLFEDDFNANLGWTVQNVALTDGPWQRGVPAGIGDRGDPTEDFDGSGSCFLTDNVAGNSDVDGGPTRVISPTLDLSSSDDPLVSYAIWFANDDFDADRLQVQVSDDNGGSWTTVENIANTGGWTTSSFLVEDFVTASNEVVVRFNATDNPNDSVTEAALDAFRVDQSTCDVGLKDCNGNGIVDDDDISSGRSTDDNGNGIPDECDKEYHLDRPQLGPTR